MNSHSKTVTRKGVKMRLIREVPFWTVYGTSWRGNSVKRDGKSVTCGHKHKSRGGCDKCLKKMRAERPGKCQDYRISECVMVVYKV